MIYYVSTGMSNPTHSLICQSVTELLVMKLCFWPRVTFLLKGRHIWLLPWTCWWLAGETSHWLWQTTVCVYVTSGCLSMWLLHTSDSWPI